MFYWQIRLFICANSNVQFVFKFDEIFKIKDCLWQPWSVCVICSLTFHLDLAKFFCICSQTDWIILSLCAVSPIILHKENSSLFIHEPAYLLIHLWICMFIYTFVYSWIRMIIHHVIFMNHRAWIHESTCLLQNLCYSWICIFIYLWISIFLCIRLFMKFFINKHLPVNSHISTFIHESACLIINKSI